MNFLLLLAFRCIRSLEVLEHEYCYLKNKLHEFLQVLLFCQVHSYPSIGLMNNKLFEFMTACFDQRFNYCILLFLKIDQQRMIVAGVRYHPLLQQWPCSPGKPSQIIGAASNTSHFISISIALILYCSEPMSRMGGLGSVHICRRIYSCFQHFIMWNGVVCSCPWIILSWVAIWKFSEENQSYLPIWNNHSYFLIFRDWITLSLGSFFRIKVILKNMNY